MIQQDKKTDQQLNLQTVKEFVDTHSFVSESMLRWQIYKSADLGLSKAFVRPFGQRRVLVDPCEYFRVMMEKHEKNSSSNV